MNELASPNKAVPDVQAEQARLAQTDVGSAPSRWRAMLEEPDRAALLFVLGLSVLGVISGARVVLGMINQADSSATTWATGLLSALYLFLAHAMAGIGLAVFLQVLAGRLAHDVRPSPHLLPEAGRDLAAVAPDQTPKSSEASREDTVAEIRRSIRAGQWSEARLLLDDFSDELPDDTRLSALEEELRSARSEAIESHAAQLDAARKVNDPERVLELHQGMMPLLDHEARASLEADLSKWFLKLIHNRLRTGKIQADVAILAGRIADVFCHTVEGASLRASLPTLRRSAGLCPRCAQPYTGLANACPQCLAAPSHPPQTPGSPAV
jgi:hypothetical protein